MIPEKSLVIYKNRPALVGATDEKITIVVAGGESVRVREKDIELLHPGPLRSLAELEGTLPESDLTGAWELLAGTEFPLSELADLLYGSWTPRTAWAAWQILHEGVYFTGRIAAVTPRSAAEIAADTAKRNEKERDAAERDAFILRLKAGKIIPGDDDRRLQDVEALAWGKSDKSRTLRDLGRTETPQEAHKLLLNVGFWDRMVNPHPPRFNLSLTSAKSAVPPPPEDEDRVDLTQLAAYAIDNAWSADPDDAVSVEGNTVWVHVADPAATISGDSPADREARDRGATLYLPEGTYRMISEAALPLYALGLTDVSPALSFRVDLNDDGSIRQTEIMRSRVRVRRLTYAEADQAPETAALFAPAERNLARRLAAGAVAIDLPETHIVVRDGSISIEPIADYRSAALVREYMLLAGEAAAGWALHRRLPFPFVAQEVGDLPAALLPGLAGSYQLRRCMRPRRLSAQPGAHDGLGLAEYTQVTSPLRRYTDLLAHQQIRAFLTGAPVLPAEEILSRLAAGEIAAQAAVQGERASRRHWTAAFLADKIGSEWEGTVLERNGNRAMVMVGALGLETQVAASGAIAPNDQVRLILQSVRIPEQETVFVLA